MHHLARHCVACFLTRGDLVDYFNLEPNFVITVSSFSDISYCIGSLCIGKRAVMSSRDFLLIQIGQLIMGIGYGSPALHFSTRCVHILLHYMFVIIV